MSRANVIFFTHATPAGDASPDWTHTGPMLIVDRQWTMEVEWRPEDVRSPICFVFG